MPLAARISKITSSITKTMKKQQLLNAFLDIYTKLLEFVCEQLDNDINIATIITIVSAIKKRNPRLIAELWHTNISLRVIDKGMTRDNFIDTSIEIFEVIKGDEYFSENVRVATDNILKQAVVWVTTASPQQISDLFNIFDKTVKLSVMYSNY